MNNQQLIMETIKHKNNLSSSGAEITRPDEAIYQIYSYLNQGNLYKIYQIMGDLSTKDEEKFIIERFLERFGFNFTRYI